MWCVFCKSRVGFCMGSGVVVGFGFCALGSISGFIVGIGYGDAYSCTLGSMADVVSGIEVGAGIGCGYFQDVAQQII